MYNIILLQIQIFVLRHFNRTMCTTSFIYGFLTAVILILAYRMWSGENFASKEEKADVIMNWFTGGGSAYAGYKKDISDSDVVEYEAVKRLKESGRLDKKSIMSAIA